MGTPVTELEDEDKEATTHSGNTTQPQRRGSRAMIRSARYEPTNFGSARVRRWER